METRELMIGDWVSHDGVYVKIECVITNSSRYKYPLGVVYSDGREIAHIAVLNVDYIPLTFDILKANGFEYFDSGKGDDWKGYVECSDKGGFYSVRVLENTNEGFKCMILVEGKTGVRNEIYVTVYYVHQLQHLLRVCGLSDMADKLKIE